MNFKYFGMAILIGIVSCGSVAHSGSAAQPKPAPPIADRDGQHDFDFNFGVWKTHIKRMLDPFAGTGESVELNGIVTVRKVWDGRAQLEEIEADGPKGHFEGLTLFLYDPRTRQWSQSFVNGAEGTFSGGMVGSFKNGRGDLFVQDTVNGRSVLIRGSWSDITPNSHHFEESLSNDGGATWQPAFVADLTREDAVPTIRQTTKPESVQDEQRRGFDFAVGTWKEHSSRLLHPLSGSKDWIEMDGASVVKQVLGGKANLVEYEGDGPKGHLELLALRVYNPKAHQWSLNFATSSVGKLGEVPGVGEFKNGRIDFYDQEPVDGKTILVRFSAWEINSNTAQTEQAYSEDGGTTWEVNWVNEYVRARSKQSGLTR